MHRKKTSYELRCVCSRKPLLAIYGIDERNRAYVHAKAWKQQRLIQEVLLYGPRALIYIHCRDCLRWTRVNLIDGASAPHREVDVPEPRVLKQ